MLIVASPYGKPAQRATSCKPSKHFSVVRHQAVDNDLNFCRLRINTRRDTQNHF